MSLEQRIYDVAKKGYKLVVAIHSAGPVDRLEEKLPSRHGGHWLITSTNVEKELSYATGFMINLEVPYYWAVQRGRKDHHYGGVYATIEDCLDEVDRVVAADEAKIAERAAIDPTYCPTCESFGGKHVWGYECEKTKVTP